VGSTLSYPISLKSFELLTTGLAPLVVIDLALLDDLVSLGSIHVLRRIGVLFHQSQSSVHFPDRVVPRVKPSNEIEEVLVRMHARVGLESQYNAHRWHQRSWDKSTLQTCLEHALQRTAVNMVMRNNPIDEMLQKRLTANPVIDRPDH